MKSLREGMKRYLECGFYLSHDFDLTSNAQRRSRPQTEPLSSIDERYMWNYHLYEHLRVQRIPLSWQIPLVQGYVQHAQLTTDLELVLIARRRWAMGGPRYSARGIDEQGNAANFVETEQIAIKHVQKAKYLRVLTYAFN